MGSGVGWRFAGSDARVKDGGEFHCLTISTGATLPIELASAHANATLTCNSPRPECVDTKRKA